MKQTITLDRKDIEKILKKYFKTDNVTLQLRIVYSGYGEFGAKNEYNLEATIISSSEVE